MKEVLVHADTQVDIIDSPIPKPGEDEVVIKVVVSGSNPKDWKVPAWMNEEPNNSGDDIAGIVHAVGSKVWEFKAGDRVAAFHVMRTPHGSFAEYASAPAHTTFHIPTTVSFEDAATLPLAVMTSCLGMYHKEKLGLPQPWTPADDGEKIPLVVYGGASAVGAFAIKLAMLSNIHPIIAVAGRGKDFVESLIDRSKGDTIIDYREGDEAVVAGMKSALKGQTLRHAFDAVSEKGSYVNIAKVLDPNGKITVVLPGMEYEELPKSIKMSKTNVGESHTIAKDFAYVYYRYIAKGVAEGWYKTHPVEVVPGGLAGVKQGLENLKNGKASAVKYVFRIQETPGLKAE